MIVQKMEETVPVYQCAGYFTALGGKRFHRKNCRHVKWSCILITKWMSASVAFSPCKECIKEFRESPDIPDEEKLCEMRNAILGYPSCVGFYTNGRDNLFHGKSCELLLHCKRKINHLMAAKTILTPCTKCLPESAELFKDPLEATEAVDYYFVMEKVLKMNEFCIPEYQKTNRFTRGNEFLQTLKEYNGR